MLKLLVDSWKGDTSLAKAFWLVFGLFGFFIRIIITAFLFLTFHPPLLWLRILIIEFALPYTIFSAICVWRCSNNPLPLWNVISRAIVLLTLLADLVVVVLHSYFLISHSLPQNNIAMKGSIIKNVYYSPSKLFAVQLPANISSTSLTVKDHEKVPHQLPEFAFFTQQYDWTKAGYYSVERFNLIKNFNQNIPTFLSHYLPYVATGSFQSDPGSLSEKPVCYRLIVNSHSAYQCYARASFKSSAATIIGTAIDMEDKQVYVMFAINPTNSSLPTNQIINWKIYNNFVDSLREI